jgi:hypothetical protein
MDRHEHLRFAPQGPSAFSRTHLSACRLEKTGTTTLQAAMAVNRQLLRRYDYVFPEGLSSFPSYHIGLALWAANPDAVSELRHRRRTYKPQGL